MESLGNEAGRLRVLGYQRPQRARRERQAGTPRLPGTDGAPRPDPPHTRPASLAHGAGPAPRPPLPPTTSRGLDGTGKAGRGPREAAPDCAWGRGLRRQASHACARRSAHGARGAGSGEGSRLAGHTVRSQATRRSESFALFPTQGANVLALASPKTFTCRSLVCATAAPLCAWRVLSLRVHACVLVCVCPFMRVCLAAREPAERACEPGAGAGRV